MALIQWCSVSLVSSAAIYYQRWRAMDLIVGHAILGTVRSIADVLREMVWRGLIQDHALHSNVKLNPQHCKTHAQGGRHGSA